MESVKKITLSNLNVDFNLDGIKQIDEKYREAKTPDFIQKVKINVPTSPNAEDELYSIDSDICDDFGDSCGGVGSYSDFDIDSGDSCGVTYVPDGENDEPLPSDVASPTKHTVVETAPTGELDIPTTGTGVTGTGAATGVFTTHTEISSDNLTKEDLQKQQALEKWSKQFTQELYEDIRATECKVLDGTSDDLYKNIINNVTSENVNAVFDNYSLLSSKTLIDDILKDSVLGKKEKYELVKHIANCSIEAAKADGIYVEDLANSLDKMSSTEVHSAINTIKINKIYDELDARKIFVENPKNAQNGMVDEEFSQGNIGDCWLLASIKSMASSPKGARILNDSIKVNEDGSVDVTFKGVDKTYNISASELNKKDNYSNGDRDVRAIEIAMDKYMQQNQLHGVDTIKDGGMPTWVFELLTGQIGNGLEKTLLSYVPFSSNVNDKLIENVKNQDFLCIVAKKSLEAKNYDMNVKNQNDEDVLLRSCHTYSAIDADDNYVYLVNPWNTSETLHMSRKDFKKFFDSAYTLNLDAAQ